MLSLYKSLSFDKLFGDFFDSKLFNFTNYELNKCKREDDGSFVVTVNLPGFTDKDVVVKSLSTGYVTVKGSVNTKTSSYTVSEVFSVPKDCNLDELKAELKNGVLT